MAAAAAGSSAAAAAAGSSAAAAAASPAPITPLGDKAAAGGVDNGAAAEADCGVCAICLDRIALQDTALVKGCDHAYCVTCILRWASYKQSPSCPQCKHPFEFLSVHRSLDGCIHDYMFDESVCLLLRATWFEPLVVVAHEEVVLEDEEIYRSYQYDDGDEDDLYEEYISRSPSIRIGNRRWGDNGYVRGGRREARPVSTSLPDDAVPARTPKKKEASASGSGSASGSVSKDVVGRRAKRAQKREAADKAAAEKHLKHLQRLGRGKIPEVLPEALPEAPPEAKALPGALEVGPQAIE